MSVGRRGIDSSLAAEACLVEQEPVQPSGLLLRVGLLEIMGKERIRNNADIVLYLGQLVNKQGRVEKRGNVQGISNH